MKKQVHVLIVANHSLLGDILENLLDGISAGRNADRSSLIVQRTTPCAYKTMLREMSQRSPVVMVVEKEALGGQLLEMVSQIDDDGRLQLIIVSSESDDVAVYTSNRATMSGAANLVMLVNAFARQFPAQRNLSTAVIPIPILPPSAR